MSRTTLAGQVLATSWAASTWAASTWGARVAGAIVVAGGALIIGATGACGDSGQDAPDACVGGVFVDGPDGTPVCEGKCSPDLCVENNVCVGNRCRLSCESHNECNRDGIELQGCLPQQGDSDEGLNDGDTVYVCTDLDKAPGFLKPCPLVAECDADFACPDGTPCAAGVGSDLCSATECRAMHCSSTAEGDAAAYCTTFDCTVDAECGPGMYCGRVGLPNIICGTDKGTEEPCVDPANFATDKATYQEGPFSLFRNACMKREPCAPCADKADCSLTDDLSCVNLNGESVCAKSCDSGDDCPNDYGCQSNFCIPKTGSCVTPPPPNFCFPCFTDLDCGPSDGTVGCIGTTAGQRACFDLSFPDSCTSDANCPTAPSGLNGECLDEPDGYDSSSSVYQRCFVPYTQGKFQCWKD